MTFAKRLATISTIALVAMMSVSIRSSAQTSKPFVIGIAENTTSLDPARGFEPESGIILKAAYDTLVTFPADNVNKILPHLATSWTISSDGLTYTFTLKDGVHFSSGNPMTASDAVFSFNRMKNIKGNPSFLADDIDSVTAPDAKTVVIKLTAPDPALLAKLVFPAFSV